MAIDVNCKLLPPEELSAQRVSARHLRWNTSLQQIFGEMVCISVVSSHADLRSIKMPAERYYSGTNYRAVEISAIAALRARLATANMDRPAVHLDPGAANKY